MIGFPEFILDPKELDDVYDGVSSDISAHVLTCRRFSYWTWLINTGSQTEKEMHFKELFLGMILSLSFQFTQCGINNV